MCGLVEALMSERLSSKDQEESKRHLASAARAYTQILAEMSRLGIARLPAGSVPVQPDGSPGGTRVGRWHRQRPPGWDDESMERDALDAMRAAGQVG